MYIDTTFPPDGSQRLAAFLSSATMLGAEEIGLAVDALIAKLDALAGDPDVEPNGDELDQSYPEVPAARFLVVNGRSTGLEDAEEDDEAEDDDPEEDDDEDTCQAGDDGCAPFMTYFGPRWGSHEDEVDREPELCGGFAHGTEAGTFAANDA